MTKEMTVVERSQNLKSLLLKALPSIQGVAAKALSPERLIRIALVAASRRPDLGRCSPQSILQALVLAAEVGLEPETPLAHAYLVPFKNKHTGQLEATFMPSAKGLAALAVRFGVAKNVWARVVREGEQFEHVEGLSPRLEHRPNPEADGELRAAYAVAELEGGVRHFEVMYRKEIEKVQASSRAGDKADGPWMAWPEMMWRKTCLKRLLRNLPMDSEQLATAIGADDDERPPTATTFADVIPIGGEEPAPSRAEDLKRELKSKRKDEPAAAPTGPPPAMSDEEIAQIKATERAERARGEDDDR